MVKMKISRSKILLAVLVLAAFVVAAFFVIEKYTERSLDTTIKYNYESGFYDEPIDIEISVGKSYFITYTLDGTDPTLDSEKYTGPIHIDDASKDENRYANLKETSTAFFDKNSIYAPATEKVDKCTVVRASAYDYSGRKVSSSLKEYFIGFQDKKGYDGLYTVCIGTSPVYLFEDNVGIYTMGAGMREFIDSGEADEFNWESGNAGRLKSREANWFIDGPQSERDTTLQIFDPDGNVVLDTVCGMRVRGHDSRHDPQKSIGFYAREEYSGSEYFDWDIFGTGSGPHSFVVFSGADDSDVKIKDYIIHSIEKEAGSNFTTSTFIPCNFFIQGEYWGPMYIMEDLNDDFLSTTYGVDSNNVRLIKGNTLKASVKVTETASDVDEWSELREFIKNNDMSDAENYEYVCSKIDMDSFIDYAATEIYIANSNWREENNSAEWRCAKKESGNKYADGKWRFCLYDVNDSLKDWGDETPSYFKRALDFQPTVKALGKNKDFERAFKERVEELESMYTEERVDELIENWREVMQEPVECYFTRFADKPGVDANEEIEKEIAGIRQFIKNRPSQMEILYDMLFD